MPVFSQTNDGNFIVMADGEEVVYNKGDIAWILTSAALVFIMCPGVGFLYSGLLRRKNALSMLWLSLAVYCVVAFQWFFWGYSLTFGTGGPFIGDLSHFGLINVLDQPSGVLPAIVFCIYQSMFACITAILAVGGFAERGRLAPILVFAFCWTTIVYDPIAHWTWGGGWSGTMGDLDFAGGAPVHMSSGAAALAISVFLGKRRGWGTEKLAYRPHSVSHVVIGTVFLWFGWFGFNGGSALASDMLAAQAMIVTNVAAAVGGITWMCMDWFWTRHWSAVSLCSGIITGLIAITPAAGYVGAPSSIVFGFVGAIAANVTTKWKHFLKYDDTLDVWATHGVGGFTGALLTGLFADGRVLNFASGEENPDPLGWINQNYVQFGYQLAAAVAAIAWSFVVTLILLCIFNWIPGFRFRSSEEAEILGIDETECEEAAYDFAFVNRDLENPDEVAQYMRGNGAKSSSEPSVAEKPAGSA